MITKLKVFWPGRFSQYQAILGLQTQKQIEIKETNENYEGCALFSRWNFQHSKPRNSLKVAVTQKTNVTQL